MYSENLDIDSTMKARRKALEQSIRTISHGELKSVGEQIFAEHPGHPWKDAFDQFLRENPHGTFYHATTHDKFQLVYCREKEKGFWFLPGGGMGILMEKGVAAMKEITNLH